MRSLKYFITHPAELLISAVKKYGSFIPDKWYLELRYKNETGKKLNINHPRTFTEKIQWLKLHTRNPEYTQMVDKFAVKAYVARQIGDEYIIPTLGIWNKFEEIDFAALPNQFVLKTTHGGGNTGVVIIHDSMKLDKDNIKKQLEWSMKNDVYIATREWPYKNVKKRFIAEKYLKDESHSELCDYKWFCFDGEPLYCQVIRDRNTLETIDFYDTDWHKQDFVGLNPNAKNGKLPVPKPYNLKQMIDIAKKLSYGHPFLRVDLYEVNNKLYFGELTFFPASGFGMFTPEDWDLKLGNLINLPK